MRPFLFPQEIYFTLFSQIKKKINGSFVACVLMLLSSLVLRLAPFPPSTAHEALLRHACVWEEKKRQKSILFSLPLAIALRLAVVALGSRAASTEEVACLGRPSGIHEWEEDVGKGYHAHGLVVVDDIDSMHSGDGELLHDETERVLRSARDSRVDDLHNNAFL